MPKSPGIKAVGGRSRVDEEPKMVEGTNEGHEGIAYGPW